MIGEKEQVMSRFCTVFEHVVSNTISGAFRFSLTPMATCKSGKTRYFIHCIGRLNVRRTVNVTLKNHGCILLLSLKTHGFTLHNVSVI